MEIEITNPWTLAGHLMWLDKGVSTSSHMLVVSLRGERVARENCYLRSNFSQDNWN